MMDLEAQEGLSRDSADELTAICPLCLRVCGR
jgi:hypothetical protein